MSEQARQLAHLRSSTSALHQALERERWSDDDLRRASLLPGWTRGHVLTHIARNADSIASTVAGALRGDVVQRYPGGPEQREADIQTGAQRGALDQLADVRDSADRLDRLFGAAAEADAWHLPCDTGTIGQYVLSRWREVEIHRVDLASSYGPADWPGAFVSYLVPELIETASERSDAELHIHVSVAGSVTTDLAESTWTVGEGPAIDVTGPDWAVAAWLIGRVDIARDELSATPALRPWM